MVTQRQFGTGVHRAQVGSADLDRDEANLSWSLAYLEGIKEALESSPEGGRYVRSIRGRRRGFSHSGDLTEREKRQAANAVVQMLEADVFKKMVLELDKAFKRESLPVEIVLLLHDGIWFTCPEDYLQQAKMLIKQVMENSVSLSVPLKIDFE